MRLISWFALGFLTAGCLVSDADPTGAGIRRRPDAGGSAGHDDDSVADDLGPLDPDGAEDGCRKLILLDPPPRMDNPASSLPETPLELDVQYENGVAVVTLQGPQVLVDRATECQIRGFAGFGYEVSWDDEPRFLRIPRACSEDLRHVFHIGGTFDIWSNTFESGANDAPVYKTRQSARIVVDSAKLKPRELPLKLSIAGKQRTFRLAEGPNLTYVIHKNRPVYLCVELRDETGVIGTSKLFPIRNHVDGELSPYQYIDFGEPYQAALRARQSKFLARAFVFDESKQLLDRAVTEPFRLTEQNGDDVHHVTFANDGLNVTMELESFTPSCVQLDIDWGDGSPRTQKRPETMLRGCMVERGVFRFSHSYARPGSYEVLLHVSEFDPWIPLEDVLGYSTYTVKVDAP